MHSDVKAAIRLQEVDNQAAGLSREVAALPKHIALIETKLAASTRRVELDKAALLANGKERRRLDGEIQVQAQKISKLRDQMLAAKNNDQYKSFQHEIEFCETETRKHEDRILELMTESEALDKNVKAAEGALAEEKKRVEAERLKPARRPLSTKKPWLNCKLDVRNWRPKSALSYLKNTSACAKPGGGSPLPR